MSSLVGLVNGRWGVVLSAALVFSTPGCSSDDPAAAPIGADAGAPDQGASGGAGGTGGSAVDASANGGGGTSNEDPSGGNGAGASPATFCEPLATIECQQDLLCTGIATCAADGSAFSACDCGAPALDGSVDLVGQRCESDADCQGGAVCLQADENDFSGVGGPSGGYCTFPCELPQADADCLAKDPESRCVGIGAGAFCFRTCLSKDPLPGEEKCLNRGDVACFSEAALRREVFSADRQNGVCLPSCGSDADCPQGRFCHRQGGICTTFPSPGASTGASCGLDSDCDGLMCESRVDGVGICTATCVLGSLSGCGFAADATVREVGCLTPMVAAGRFSEGVGDVGLCRELCDVDTDCQRAGDGLVCRPLTADAAAFLGRSGACAGAE
jgi:hypothetical protein